MPSSCAVSTVQVKPFFDEAAPLSGEQMMAANPYRPWPARITSITPSISRASCGKFIASSTFGQSESMIVPSVPGMWRYTSSVMNGMNG